MDDGFARRSSWLALLLLAAGLASLPHHAGAEAPYCDYAASPDVTGSGVRSGYVDPLNPDWYRHLASGPASWSLTPPTNFPSDNVDLFVYSDDCGTLLCQSTAPAGVTDSCSVASGYNFRVEVRSYTSNHADNYTLTFSGQPPAVCSDTIDNDGDGKVDYPDDPGCSSPGDPTEGCQPTAPGVVACLEPGAFYQSFGSAGSPGASLAGYVDLYRFVLPGDVTTNVPCIALKEGSTFANPCATLGGTFLSRQSTLFELDPASSGPGAVRICRAELTATVMGAGIQSAPAYAPC